MKVGVRMFSTDLTISPAHLASEAEARGFSSLFLPEHTHIPVVRRSPHPSGGPMPEEYKRTLDPFVALAAAAAVTNRIRLGTGICLVAQRDAVLLAKEVATLDVVSNGRFVFGIGVGWNEEEMEDHGVDPSARRRLVREKVLAMQALWTEDEASFAGDVVRFGPTWSWPKPVQEPHPPILMGGAGGPVTFRHVAEYCDGWMPPPLAPKELLDRRAVLDRELAAAGRSAASVVVKVFGVSPDRAILEAYADCGVDEVVLSLPSAPADVVLPLLDGCSDLLGIR